MSNAPKPLAPLTEVQRLLMMSKAAREQAQVSRNNVAFIATLRHDDRAFMRASSKMQAETARQLEQQGSTDEAEAVELVRQMPPAEAQSYLEHTNADIRVAAMVAVCATTQVRR